MAGTMIAATNLGVRASFGVFFKSIESEFNLSRAATSGVFSVYMLLCSIVAILGGWALDKYGPRLVVFLMGWFAGLGLLLTSQTHAAWQLYVTYGLLFALGTGATFTVVNSTTSRWFDKKRGLALGITTSGGGLGQIAMAPFATYLIANFDWRVAFAVIGLIAWLVVASLSLVLRKAPSDIGLLPDGVKAEGVKIGLQNRENNRQPDGLSLPQAYRTRSFWFMVFAWMFCSLSLHLVLTHSVPHAIDMGISPMDAAVIISLIGGAIICGRLVLGRISDIIGRKALAVGCALVEVGALIWLIWIRELWMFHLFAIVFGFSSGGLGMLTTALVGDVFGVRYIGAILGAVVVGWAVGAAIGPAMGGFVFDASGSYFIAFAIAAVAILITGLLVALIRTEVKT